MPPFSYALLTDLYELTMVQALDEARAWRAAELNRLSASLRAIAAADPPYTVNISARLAGDTERLRQHHERSFEPAHHAKTRST